MVKPNTSETSIAPSKVCMPTLVPCGRGIWALRSCDDDGCITISEGEDERCTSERSEETSVIREESDASAATITIVSNLGKVALPGTNNTGNSKRKRKAIAVLEQKAKNRRVRMITRKDDDGNCVLNGANRMVHVKGCPPTCPCGRITFASTTEMTWCSVPVMVSQIDWPMILRPEEAVDTIQSEKYLIGENQEASSSGAYSKGQYGEIQLGMGCGMTVHVVEHAQELPAALENLKKSMKDSIIGIDLEWRPDKYGRTNNKVALVQLASASVVVLVRVCKMGFKLPVALRSFFSDDSVTFVAFSWHSGDELKMLSTFGKGRALFSRFIDLQRVGEGMGYFSCGLAALTLLVLGVPLPKSRSVSRSDWQADKLSPSQIKYAAFDAFITAHVYRGLRLWHASPSSCTQCKHLLGVTSVS